jgi:hypothetical protein
MNGASVAPTGELIVHQFFKDGSYECVAQFVDADEALHLVHRCMRNRHAVRITITDGSGHLYGEWDQTDMRMGDGNGEES